MFGITQKHVFCVKPHLISRLRRAIITQEHVFVYVIRSQIPQKNPRPIILDHETENLCQIQAQLS